MSCIPCTPGNTPSQMYDEYLDALKGWPSQYAVDKAASPADGENIGAGMAVHLNAAGQFERGVCGQQMAIFALQNYTDYDVLQCRGGISGGHMSGLVACGAYELESTQYVDDTYNPNDTLTSSDNGSATDGLLQRGTVYVDAICGVVSDGVVTTEYALNHQALRFWPVYLPAPAGSSSPCAPA